MNTKKRPFNHPQSIEPTESEYLSCSDCANSIPHTTLFLVRHEPIRDPHQYPDGNRFYSCITLCQPCIDKNYPRVKLLQMYGSRTS